MTEEIKDSRKLAAIMFADMVNYTALMQEDESKARAMRDRLRNAHSALVAQYSGQILQIYGDGVLCSFASAIEATHCAIELQKSLREKPKIPVRIGIHVCDVIFEEGGIVGDGVNVASRIEQVAANGGICVSDRVYDDIKNQPEIEAKSLGPMELKNVKRPIEIFALTGEGLAVPKKNNTRVTADLESGKAKEKLNKAKPADRRRMLTYTGLGIFILLLLIVAVYHFSRQDRALELPTGPVIAVLPFTNLSGDPEQEFFADGISEEIITALTRFDEIFILARNTTFQFKGQAVDVTQVGRELGARYVLEGSVQRAAGRVRVTAQLLDADAGTHLWAETYERDLTTADIFYVMNDITSRVVGAIADAQGVITRAEGRRARTAAPDNLAAYDCVLQAHAYWVVFTRDLHAKVRACLEGAVKREPTYAEAWAWLAMLTIDEYRLGFNPQPEPRRRTTAAAREAVRLAPDSEVAYQALAYSRFYDDDLDGFFVAAERALELNPNNAQVIASLGLHLVYAGESERGLALLQKAAVLNPQHPGWYYFPSMYVYYGRGEYELALAEAKKLEQTDVFWAPAWLAAIYGQLGRVTEARGAVAELLRMNPTFPSTFREEYLKWFKSPPEEMSLLLEGLSKAGLEIP